MLDCLSCSFWEPKFVERLLEDKTARNLLYIEALWAVDRGQLEVSSESEASLAALRKKAMKIEVGG